ncbi:TolC family protein [Synergistes jonesii]|uniref:TolC family protein n=1 Tax=Synergistes jonesii TaxID=2754 RepID=UPI00248EF4A4|nr:TolC family protein [Synergistes jonesii]
MYIRRFIAAFMMTLAVSAAASAADDALLESLLSAAERNNPQISAAAERTAAAEARLAGAAAQMGPKAAAAMGALWSGGDFEKEVGVMGTALSVPVLESHTYAAAVMLTQTIYSGGSLQARKEAARLAKDASEARGARTKQGVDNAVRRAYYAVRAAQAKELVAEEAASLAKEHKAQAEKLFNAGIVAKSDVLRSNVAVASSELDVIRARNATAVAMTALRRAVGADLPGDIEKKEPLSSILSREGPPYGADTSADVAAAYESREELKAYSLLSRQAEKLARAAKGLLLPQILGAVGYAAAGDSFFPDGYSEPVAALGVYWNFYDGGAAKAKTDEAKANARELLFLLDDMKNVIRMEVTQAESSLSSAGSRLEVARRQLAESREDYRIAQRRYAESVGTNLDALDARLALANSMSEVVTAFYDIKSAEADLIYAMGR